MTPIVTHTSATRTSHQRQRGVQRIRALPDWLCCLVLAALWLGCTAWLRPLAIPDEGRYVGVAWEMLNRGNWLVPTLDGLPFFHKPPLFYWITASSMQVFGPSVAASRVAPWLASVCTVMALFIFVKRWVGSTHAWATVIVLATVPLFYGAAQYANLDLLVAACMTAAILLFAHAALARTQGLTYHRSLAAAFLAAALGVLSKGLIGVAVPLLVLVTWGMATRRLGKVVSLLMWAPGWLLFAAVATPWFIAMQERFPDFGHYFFVVQHLKRFASTGFNNAQPWWFYPTVLLLLTLPWSPLLLDFLLRRRRVRFERSDVRTLMLTWCGVVVAFFSLPNSKLVGYILPALPPLAFLIADATRCLQERQRSGVEGRPVFPTMTFGKQFALTAGVAAVGCVALVVSAHFFQPKSRQVLAETLRSSMQLGEPVIFLDNFYYDVLFYARLATPVSIVDRWPPAEVAKDSWRRELVDAERFATTDSVRRLLRPEELEPALCKVRSSWIIGPWPATSGPTWLAEQPPLYQSNGTALWHIVSSSASIRATLQCSEPAG